MQRGTLDGSLFSISLAKSYKINEVAKYSTFGAKVGYATIIYCVNEEFWKNLSPDMKKAMLQASSEILPHAWKELDAMRKSVKEDFQAGGVLFTDITGDNLAVWKEKLEPVRSQWAATMKARGLPGDPVLAEWDRALAATR